MLVPANEQIQVSSSPHSIAVSRDVTTPGYGFPNQSVFQYQAPFLKAGVRGLGCTSCGLMGVGNNALLLLGLAALIIFLLPPKYSRF